MCNWYRGGTCDKVQGMNWANARVAGALTLLAALPWRPAAAALPSGEAVYQKRCTGCHERSDARIPSRDALQKMPSARILRALESGAMMAIAFTMPRDERIAVASYLGTPGAIPGPLASA